MVDTLSHPNLIPPTNNLHFEHPQDEHPQDVCEIELG
jgi:hypothetical protein